MTDLNFLLKTETELEQRLDVVRKLIYAHPIRINERIQKGITEFGKLIKYEKGNKKKKAVIRIMKSSLVDYDMVLDADHNAAKPARHYIHRFVLDDEWVIVVGIFLETGNTKYEMSINFSRKDVALNVSGYESTIDEKMQSIQNVFINQPGYLYYKPLIEAFVQLLYIDLIDEYFGKLVE